MTNIIETLADVFALATNATEFVNTCLKENKSKNKTKDSAQLASSGNWAQLASSGNWAQLASSGYSAQLASSGYSAQLASSGDSAKLASSGDSAKLASSGNWAQLASSGNSAKLASSGNSAQLASSGNWAVISAIGHKSIAKAKIGSWITLAEYKKDKNGNIVVDFVKTEFVDGKKIKDEQFYCLYKHEFREFVDYDGIKAAKISSKGNICKIVAFDDFFTGREMYVIEKDGVYSHGRTIKEAKESFIYKISNRDTSAYKEYTLDTIVSKEEAIKMYRAITGACEAGTRYFVENLPKVKKKYSVTEIIELTNGQYNSDVFRNFFEKE